MRIRTRATLVVTAGALLAGGLASFPALAGADRLLARDDAPSVPVAEPLAEPPDVPPVVPTNQVIVRSSGGAAPDAARLSRVAGSSTKVVRPLGKGEWVVRLAEQPTTGELRSILVDWEALPGIVDARADVIMRPSLIPNDTSYPSQWALRAPTSTVLGANLPAAWDVTTGSSSVVVAVLDSGVRPHPDLAGRMLPGYDFITNPPTANDGGGRDVDPSDPGDWVTQAESDAPGGPFQFCQVENSSWHGTHVSGTIAAVGNNGIGVTGVAWGSKILPVRVLGKCGGYQSDIVDAMRWAAGLPVSGVPVNPNPARILNMSFGSPSVCDATMQSAVDDVLNAGVTVVAAAGNEAVDGHSASPGGCDRLISVAATGSTGSRAGYSNFGTSVDIAAPGGDDGVGFGGILSTYNTGTTTPGADSYATLQGTSMAAPHISGIAALVEAVGPTRSPAQIRNILRTTVTPFPVGSTCATVSCGPGIVNAAAAVLAPVAPPTVPGVPVIDGATARNASVEYRFGAPVDDGGSSITGYTATCSAPGRPTRTANATNFGSLTVTGLVNFVAYSCNLRAINAIGAGPPSPSVSLTPSVPANDNFANNNLITLSAAGSVTGTNVNASKQAGEPLHAEVPGGSSVWWRFIPTSSGIVTLSTEGSGFDTVLAVYTGGAVNSLTPVVSNDDALYSQAPGTWSRATFPVAAGTTYRVAVDGFNIDQAHAPSGPITLGWTYSANGARVTAGLTSKYELNEGAGSIVSDSSGVGSPLDLTIEDPSKVSWVTGGLRLNSATRVMSVASAAKIVNASKASGGVTIEAWVESSSLTQTGPARIVAVSADSTVRDVELTEAGANFEGRVRADRGGTASLSAPGAHTMLQHVVFTRSASTATHLFIDGVERSFGVTAGNLSTWDATMRLALGNVPGSTGRPWLGELQFVATYGRQLDAVEIAHNYAAGPGDGVIPPEIDPPANDHFANATPIAWSLQGSVTGTNVNATTEVGEPDHGGLGHSSVWWTMTAPANGAATLDTYGSNFDTTLSVYTGTSVGALTQVAANDDQGSAQSRVEFPVVAGTTYRIAVDSGAPTPGDITLHWDTTPPPANDAFAAAAAITWSPSGSLHASNVNTTKEPGEPLHAGRLGGRSLWWTLTAPVDGQVGLDTLGSSFDATLAVYTGSSVGSLSLVAADDGNGPNGESVVSFPVTAGTTYRIAVDGFYRDIGAITLRWHTSAVGARVSMGVTSLYRFDEGSGAVVGDSSGVGAPLDLSIEDVSKVSWVPGGLRLNSATHVMSSVGAAKVVDASKASGGVTVEAWLRTSSASQGGPARIVGVSADAMTRDVELTQSASSFEGRVRSGMGATSYVSATGVGSSLQHVVFVREPGGATRLFVDGVLVATGSSSGGLSTWDASMRLVLGNVPGASGRPWLGELDLVATYGRALSASEVAQNFSAGPGVGTTLTPTVPTAPTGVSVVAGDATAVVSFGPPVSDGHRPVTQYTASCAAAGQETRTATGASSPLAVLGLTNGVGYSCSVRAANEVGVGPASNAVSMTPGAVAPRVSAGLTALYGFGEGSGSVVADSSGVGVPLDLSIEDTSKVSWVPGGLRLNAATRVISSVGAAKIIDASKASGGVTVEAWLKSASAAQTGPARVVAVSADAMTRDVELTQMASSFEGRVRSGMGATSAVSSVGVGSSLQHVVFVREPGGATRLFVDGVLVGSGSSSGGLSTWDASMRLVLGNVPGTAGRAWLGELDLVATYGRALSAAEVTQNFTAGPDAA